MKQVDIIIPVYNGYDDIQLCMESIFKYTDLTTHRVLLVNDKSPDERILPLLQSYVREHVELIDSPVNEGFSASVNKGMLASDTDVILLNSDTIVTKNWVEKIVACAYHDKETGTVTPLSNSATLCSTPIMCQDNDVPANVTIDEYAQIIEHCSFREYPRITVAVGFCMFIKREVIDLVGLFDGATFQRGYGEENDFCNRAEQYGYKHVMCDDTFVYHKGTVSFLTEEKQRLIEDHDRILRERYPRQMEKNHLYCINNPDQYIRDNINIYTQLKNGRKNVLYLIHADFREDAYDHAGGTQYHVKDLTMGLKEEYNIFVMARDREYLRLTVYFGEEMLSFKYYIGPATLYPMYTNKKLEMLFDEILSAFSIELVHIHQTSGLSLDMYYCAHKMNIPVIATIHDYYYICPTIKLLDTDDRFCVGCATDQGCKDCLKKQAEIATQVDFLKKWREENQKALALCAKIVTPSESAKEIFLTYFPSLKEKMQVIAHGSQQLEYVEKQFQVEQIVQSSDISQNIDYAFDFPMSSSMIVGWGYLSGVNNDHVGVILEIKDSQGKVCCYPAVKQERADVWQMTDSHFYEMSGFSLSVHKQQFAPGELRLRVLYAYEGVVYCNGEEIVVQNQDKEPKEGSLRVAFLGGLVPAKGSDMAYSLIKNSSPDIQWYIFGTLGDQKLASLEQPNLNKIGTYERDSIYQLLTDYKIDLICILPIWAETFCYTLSEAWLCNIPVLVTDIGAVGERVKEKGAGIVVPLDAQPEMVLEQIQQLAENPQKLEQLRREAKEQLVDTIEEMLVHYRQLYQQTTIKQPEYGTFSGKTIFAGYQGKDGTGAAPEAGSEQLMRELAELQRANQQLMASRQAMAQIQEFQSSRTFKAVNATAKALKPVKKGLGKVKRVLKK